MRTRWADDVDARLPHPEYPRPQLRRPRWTNLNGPWRAAVTAANEQQLGSFDEEILVPFPMGSELSGLPRTLQPDERLWMQRGFTTPARGEGERVLLHFGAVDWECTVWCNDVELGTHRGAHDPFSFDITDALTDSGTEEITVAVTDPTDTGTQPLGKQSLTPFLIQYSAMSGIWQTVWLEPVPATHIRSVVTTTNLADEELAVTVGCVGGDAVRVTATGADGASVETVQDVVDDRATVDLRFDALTRWSPDEPHLYELRVELLTDGHGVDVVDSYCGAREIAVGTDDAGVLRLHLNGAPVFHHGLLDQGWWPDGLYTAPTDEALAFDIEATRAMGFNTIRKHVKVEPARWYWHADRLGVLVWQDMPSVAFHMVEYGTQMAEGLEPTTMDWSRISPCLDPDGYRRELDRMLDTLAPFPSIVVWVPFNESWGQHDTAATLAHVADRDPTRLVDGPSGWVDEGSGHIRDHHTYNREREWPGPDAQRPVVYGEYGGLKLAVEGHVMGDDGWGYVSAETPESFAAAYGELTRAIAELIPQGLAGAIYTQTTDVESEINGLLTYDRRFKLPAETIAALGVW